VASESQAPPPAGGGGNAKYIVLTLLLFGGAAAMWFALNKEEPPPAAPAPAVADAGTRAPQPPEGLDIEIPPEEPDMGPGEDLGPPTKRIVYRYVGGGGGGGWDCSGEVPNARSVMAEARRQVQNCYERQLKTNNTLQGTVTLSVKVGASGAVAATQVGGTLRDNEVFACVRNVAQSLRFSAPVGGSCAVVQQPFTLSPRN
jgi:outer membrane biosynthesis protein TonB